MSTSTKTESASRRLATVQRHPVSLFFALTYAVSWSLWTPLVIFGDHMPGTLGFVLTVSGSLVPSTVGILIVARLHGKRGVRTLLGLVPLGVGLSVLFGGQSPVIASTIVGVVVGRLVDLPRERSGRGARMARACPAASAIPPQRPARKPYRRSALGIVASAAVLDRSGAPSAEPLSSVRSQCRRCVSGLHLDVQRHQRKPAHRRALPRHRQPAPDSLPRTPWRSRRSAVPDLRRAERHHGGNDRGGHRARTCLPHTPQTGNHTIDSGREIHAATDRSARRAAGPCELDRCDQWAVIEAHPR
jgi:hypothetical protein